MLQHAPFRQMIWLAQTTINAIESEPAGGTLSIPHFKFFPGLEDDDGSTLTIFDAAWLHTVLGGDAYDTTVMPLLEALVWLELAFFFWWEAHDFF